MKDEAIEMMKKNFRPDFINRIDDIIVFSPLTEEEIIKIIDIATEEITERLKERNITIHFSKKTKKFIAEETYSPQYGARPIKRYLKQAIETKIAEKLIKGEIKDGDDFEIDLGE